MKKNIFFIPAVLWLLCSGCANESYDVKVSAVQVNFTSEKIVPEASEDPQREEIIAAVDEKFADISSVDSSLKDVLRHVKYYYPDFSQLKVYYYISSWDYQNPVLFIRQRGEVYIALDNYLGADSPLYDGIPQYWRARMDQKCMARDFAQVIAGELIPQKPGTQKLVEKMVYQGKVRTAVQHFLPGFSPQTVMGYSDQQWKWCEQNERNMWSYLIENDLLYDSSPSAASRFLEPSPFTKFYLETDQLSPGQAGAWMGWQMIGAFCASHKGTPLLRLLQMDCMELFNASGYRP